MRRPFVLSVLSVLFVLSVATPAEARRRAVAKPSGLAVPQADAIAQQFLASGIPGISIAVRKGGADFVRGYGLYDVEANVPVGANSVFQIGSVSKQFTAAAIMRLVEQGKLTVDDKARLYMPELDERFDAITIRHLLQHSSGLREYNTQLASAYEPLTQQQILTMITSGGPEFAAGRDWVYRNSGYFVLGMIIERASAKSYDQFLRDELFTPLGLTNTSYCGTTSASPDGYYRDGNTLHRLPAAHMSLLFAAGALCSTSLDLVKWNDALVNGRAVTPASYEAMIKDTFRLGPNVGYGYGLVVQPLDGRKRVWHNGDVLGFETALYWFPEEDLTVAVTINYIDLNGDAVSPIADAVARSLKP